MEDPEEVQKRATEKSPRKSEPLPFVGRRNEVLRLHELYARHDNVLILGTAGIGKSTLVRQVSKDLPLLVSSTSAHFGEICDNLEHELALEPSGFKLLKRKQRLREALWRAGKPIVFDGVVWATPKLSSYFESVAQRAPVWICARSEHPWDIGHIWPLLVRFERVELHSFHLAQTQALVEAYRKAGLIPGDTVSIIEWLHRRSAGNPLVLRELLEELATGKYDLNNPHALRRLDLDRRIHEVFPASTLGKGPASSASRAKSYD
jgi:hypothetical protein